MTLATIIAAAGAALPSAATSADEVAPKVESASQEPRTDKPSGEKKQMAEEQKKKKRKPGAEAVLARARQMARAEKRKIWAALKIPGEFDETKFAEAIESLSAKAEAAAATGDRFADKARDLEAKNRDLEAKNRELQQKLTKTARDLAAKTSAYDDLKIETGLREAAKDAGIIDPDYGLELFKRHIRTLPPDAHDPSPGEWFSELKKDPNRKHLFRAEDVDAGPRPASESLAGKGTTPATNQPPPKPAAGANEQPPSDAGSMNRRDFKKHSLETYGYTPGS